MGMLALEAGAALVHAVGAAAAAAATDPSPYPWTVVSPALS
jgi:hypothetical protein